MILKPIRDRKDTEVSFGVFDIEAQDWENHVVTGFYAKEKGDEIFEYFRHGKDFIEFIMSEHNPKDLIYAHYGGKFDFLYAIQFCVGETDYIVEDMIFTGSRMLTMRIVKEAFTDDPKKIKYIKEKQKRKFIRDEGNGIYYRDRVVELRDSYSILPSSLRDLCESFNVEHKKLETDYDNIVFNKELLKYLEYDLKGHYEVLEKYFNWDLIKKVGPAMTAAGQAIKIFRATLKKEIKRAPENVEKFVRRGYFGGRTEIFKPLFKPKDKKERAFLFDVNSLYPTIMQRNRFPGNFKSRTDEYIPDSFGFYEAEVDVPLDMYIPPLGIIMEINHTEKLIFPVGRFKGVFSTVELEYAKTLGVKVISTGQGYLFEDAGYLFKDFVDMLYKIRLESQPGDFNNFLAKTQMNSCYGKFALNRDREKIIFDDFQTEGKEFAEFMTKRGRVRLLKLDHNLSKAFSNTAVAAWVTSLSRIHMHQIMLKDQENLFYIDTDGIITTSTYPDERCLGGLKKEITIKLGCFVLPKLYSLVLDEKCYKIKDKKGKTMLLDIKNAGKGFDKLELVNVPFETYEECIRGDLSKFKVKTREGLKSFKMAIKTGSFVVKEDSKIKELKATYDKRRIIEKGKYEFDTVPLIVKDGVVIN